MRNDNDRLTTSPDSDRTFDGTCADCVHWAPMNPRAVAEDGECRRHPPTLSTIAVAATCSTRTAWPSTRSRDWCGDHRRGAVAREMLTTKEALAKVAKDFPNVRVGFGETP